MSRAKLHAPSSHQPGKPLCGRQLSAAGSRPEVHLAVQGTGSMRVARGDETVTCRHCLRALGLLLPLAAGRRYDPDASIQAMSDDELLEALMEGEEDQ